MKDLVRKRSAIQKARPRRRFSGEMRDSGKHGLNAKTKFEEFLEMDMKTGNSAAQEDVETERRLAKKLKAKNGKLRGVDDGINFLLDGLDDDFDDTQEKALDDFSKDEIDNEETSDAQQQIASSHEKSRKLRKSMKKQEADGDVMEGGEENSSPQLEEEEREPSRKKRRRRKKSKKKQEEDQIGDKTNGETKPAEPEIVLNETGAKTPAVASSQKFVPSRLRARVGIESDEHTLVRGKVHGLLNKLHEFNVESVTRGMATIFHSLSRSVSCQIICDAVLTICMGGEENNAAVFAAFAAGMACSVGMDFSAKLLASLALTFEDEYCKENERSLEKLTLLLSFLYKVGVCSSDLIFDFLIMLSKRLRESDVSTILTVLNCCGMKIRGDDPAAMKNFIQNVQNKVNELKASPREDQEKLIGRRMEFMLEIICDVKNNKKRPEGDTAQHTQIKKWLQKLGVEKILIRGIKWSKLLDSDKKGQWWLSGDRTTDDVEVVASRIDKEVPEAQKMLQLAASQRMNTDARKAIFCIIMSGEDYIDAFEKLLRLDLPGKQDREIMRVLVECCLQEMAFNKYYTALASKLCAHDKNHKYTLQYCIWDHFKELESMQLLRSMHLAKFVAAMVACFTLSLSALKSVELSDAKQLTSKRIMHFRILFESLFEYPEKVVWNAFTRIAINPELEALRHGIEFFMKEYVVKSNKALNNKVKLVKKALSNTEGILI